MNGSPAFANLQITMSVSMAYSSIQGTGGGSVGDLIQSSDNPLTKVLCSGGNVTMSEAGENLFRFDRGA